MKLSFQAKVLIPVLGLLASGSLATLWIVNRQVTEQAEAQAVQSLDSARKIFLDSLSLRKEAATDRFGTFVNDPRLRATLQVQDVATLRKLSEDFLREYGDDLDYIAFTSADGEELASVQRGDETSTDALIEAIAPIAEAAIRAGANRAAMVTVGQHLHQAVAMPLYLPDGRPLGIWSIATRLRPAQLERLRELLPPTDIVLADLSDQVLVQAVDADAALPAGAFAESSEVRRLSAGGHHYLVVSGLYLDPVTGPVFKYALLSSSDGWRAALAATRRQVTGFGVAAVLLAGAIVSLIIRKVTQPLVVLRDQAEAVGRGDFSRRIERIANDETGELAEAFNAMTGNLHASRAELERALQTLRETQAQLVQSEKLSAVGQFVAGVAHELNNPLTSVVGYADLLLHDPAHAEGPVYLQRINQAAERCRKIVQNLLSFSRQHPPERREVRLEEVCDAVIEFLAYEMRHSGVKVERRYGDGVPPIIGDTHQLQQVVLNLANNARQALEEFRDDGVITLTTEHRPETQRVVLRVADNGPGIAPEHRSRLFDPFFTTKAEGKGTGLGLSLCYGIIQEHKATITVEGARGQGAEFVLEFPVAPPSLSAAEALARIRPRDPDSAAPFPSAGGAGRRALIIDDEVWIRDVAAEVLRGEGYRVEAAEGGEEALRLLRAGHFDLVVCDWKMPGLNGMALFERVRAENKALADAFLFMTGDVVSEGFQTFLRKYARPCLPKPFSTRELRAAVAKLAAKG